MNKKTFFITGTDTNSGKTVVSCLIINSIKNFGRKVIGFKPISSGSFLENGQIKNRDAQKLKYFSNLKVSNKMMNPYFFIKPTAPHIAAKKQNITIKKKVLSENFKKLQKISEYIIIEGAGGWLTPINESQFLSDWILENKIKIILVVNMKIGCINHALLTQYAIKNSKGIIFGWVANFKNKMSEKKEYLQFLSKKICAPLIGTVKKYKNFQEIEKEENFFSNYIT
ncbi:dethiobiotin synthase [bacterium endosymbiont of Pedicinus badii]|uniref:dethiobiotin synthase n=1 Tax=bacterium endosymbiont of Pedicinus badii TaxID=1719126 RepID=UPI0009D3B897|nr:dethiobiotin synthase [bacterium endosymbiont of Pedicinus badii]OQM34336.1 hypothetical protein AOQ89_00355 [bacterium endosymbiont of Pedicinus badii]